MIVEVKVKNYRSYKDEASLTFEALDDSFNSESVAEVQLVDGSVKRVLKTAAILGPNASGKSNIARALSDVMFLVANSRDFDVKQGIPVYQPFLLDKVCRMSPSTITVMFVVDYCQYRYSITYNHQMFLEETLCEIVKEQDVPVFGRVLNNAGNGYNLSFGEGWRSTTLDLSNMNLLPNQLVLSELGKREANGLQFVYGELRGIQSKMVDNALDMRENNSYVAGTILKNEQSRLFQQLKKLLMVADGNIQDIKMREHDDSEFNFPESVPLEVKQSFIAQNRWEFRFVHKGQDSLVAFPISLESTGTKNLFSVGTNVLNILSTGGILVYDEMNVAMHPLLFRLLVRLFHSKKTNPHDAQLLFTTHDVSIVGDSLMRADQIWLAQKSGNGQSELYSVQDFEDVSIVMPFDEWYKSGRFGALPVFSDIEKVFTNAQEDENA